MIMGRGAYRLHLQLQFQQKAPKLLSNEQGKGGILCEPLGLIYYGSSSQMRAIASALPRSCQLVITYKIHLWEK